MTIFSCVYHVFFHWGEDSLSCVVPARKSQRTAKLNIKQTIKFWDMLVLGRHNCCLIVSAGKITYKL